MGAKSKISRMGNDARFYLERLLREDNLTVDEIKLDLDRMFPSEGLPSRSSIGRYKKSFAEISGRMRDIQAAASALVSDLGEDINDKAGQLLCQAVTTLAVNVAMEKNEPNAEVEVKEVADLARAARAVMQARTMSLKERQAIEADARARLITEQRAKLDELGQSGEVAQDVLKKIIQTAYGLDV